MKNKISNILLSILLSISVLLGLSFWLNIVFGFNIFSSRHWSELARLQAEHIPINSGFYISISVAIFILVFGICFIYAPSIKRIRVKTVPPQEPTILPQPTTQTIQEPEKIVTTPTETQKISIPVTRPPKLNLPSNMATIIQQRAQTIQPQTQNDSVDMYDSTLSQIFTDAGYVIKPNPTISGLKANLFAIAPDEILWIGAVNTDINKLQLAIDKLHSVFEETLEDIKININAFMLNTGEKQIKSDSIFVFNSLDELKSFVSELPPVWPKDMTDMEQENFDAYSEYIDTIIQYVRNLG